MAEDWKSYLGRFLGSEGVHRKKYLQENLSNWLKEYAAYLNEFSGVSAKVLHHHELNGQIYYLCLEVYVKQIDAGSVAPFFIALDYVENNDLVLEYTIDFDFNSVIRKDASSKGAYKYESEVLSEAGKAEKEFVLQLINQRLEKYFRQI